MDLPTDLPAVDVPEINQVGVVVEDLEEGMERWSTFFGIEEWGIHEFAPPALSEVTYRGEPGEHAWTLALGSVGAIDVELIEPKRGKNTYTAHLEAHGEGVHHLACFTLDDPEGAVASYVDAGIEIEQTGVYEDSRFWYLDMREATNGLVFEVVALEGEIPTPDRTYTPH